MKKLLLIIFLIYGAGGFVFSQKIINKKIEINEQKADLKLSFADDIIIESWSKNYIEMRVIVDIDDNTYNDFYSLIVNKTNTKTEIVEKVDFEGIKKEKGTKNLNNFNTNLNYKLSIPENLEFSLNTISGEIELIGCQGEMEIKTVSGFIDYSIPPSHKANIDLSTVTGNVYTNVNFDQKLPDKISWVGTKHKLSLNGGAIPVDLKTVSGDIFLRKK